MARSRADEHHSCRDLHFVTTAVASACLFDDEHGLSVFVTKLSQPENAMGRGFAGGESIHPLQQRVEFLAAHLRIWLTGAEPRDRPEPFTYVVDPHGTLRLAPRRSEHVACAGGGEVLAAGEIAFARRPVGWSVGEISNQSTGYCPEPSCWTAVAAALDRIGLDRPDSFTAEFTLRRCCDCRYVNVVKEHDFSCALCGQVLPELWNCSGAESR